VSGDPRKNKALSPTEVFQPVVVLVVVSGGVNTPEVVDFVSIDCRVTATSGRNARPSLTCHTTPTDVGYPMTRPTRRSVCARTGCADAITTRTVASGTITRDACIRPPRRTYFRHGTISLVALPLCT
jgi:hypothetical protein